jgi:hypothetical protein
MINYSEVLLDIDRVDTSCGIHFASYFFDSVLAYCKMAKHDISFWMAGNDKQPGGFSITGFGINVGGST